MSPRWKKALKNSKSLSRETGQNDRHVPVWWRISSVFLCCSLLENERYRSRSELCLALQDTGNV